MTKEDIVKPIGLHSICNEIERVCADAPVYAQCDVKPGPYVVHLDSGEGRTTLLEYISDMFKTYKVLPFTSGMDDYLDLSFDGSMKQLREMFQRFTDAAVYAPYYKEVAGLDISALDAHLFESQTDEFLTKIQPLVKHAVLIFFVPKNPSKNIIQLIDKLEERIGKLTKLYAEDYTIEDYVQVIERYLCGNGIEIKNTKDFHAKLLLVLESFQVNSMKETIDLAEKITFLADFGLVTPVICEDSLLRLIQNQTPKKGVKLA